MMILWIWHQIGENKILKFFEKLKFQFFKYFVFSEVENVSYPKAMVVESKKIYIDIKTKSILLKNKFNFKSLL